MVGRRVDIYLPEPCVELPKYLRSTSRMCSGHEVFRVDTATTTDHFYAGLARTASAPYNCYRECARVKTRPSTSGQHGHFVGLSNLGLMSLAVYFPCNSFYF